MTAEHSCAKSIASLAAPGRSARTTRSTASKQLSSISSESRDDMQITTPTINGPKTPSTDGGAMVSKNILTPFYMQITTPAIDGPKTPSTTDGGVMVSENASADSLTAATSPTTAAPTLPVNGSPTMPVSPGSQVSATPTITINSTAAVKVSAPTNDTIAAAVVTATAVSPGAATTSTDVRSTPTVVTDSIASTPTTGVHGATTAHVNTTATPTITTNFVGAGVTATQSMATTPTTAPALAGMPSTGAPAITPALTTATTATTAAVPFITSPGTQLAAPSTATVPVGIASTAAPTTAPALTTTTGPTTAAEPMAAAAPTSAATTAGTAPDTAGRFVDDAAISAAFSASGPAATQLATKLHDVRAVAATRDFYLALGQDTFQGITWIKAGGGSHIVVDRQLGLANAEDRAAHAAQPELNPAPPTPDLARLYIIGNISSERCFMKCDGNVGAVNPTASFQRTLANNTMVCALVKPPDEYPFLVDEFNRGINTLKAIIGADVDEPWDGVRFKEIKEEHVRLRHKVFRPKADGDPRTEHLPAEYRTASWPVNHDAEKERESLVHTHYAHPLEAFDVGGELMHPSLYVNLNGATVLVGISVTHFTFTKKNTVCLDISYLRVLIPGSPRYRSTSKRTAMEMSDPLSHASVNAYAIAPDDICCDLWVPNTFIPTLSTFLTYHGSYYDPWYSLRFATSAGGWKPKERDLSWLTVGDHPLRVWITGSLAGLNIQLDHNGSPSASVKVDLFTDVDRTAAARIFDRGRFSSLEQHLPPTPPVADLSLDIHGFPDTWFPPCYDASSGLTPPNLLPALNPGSVGTGDIIACECTVIRLDHTVTRRQTNGPRCISLPTVLRRILFGPVAFRRLPSPETRLKRSEGPCWTGSRELQQLLIRRRTTSRGFVASECGEECLCLWQARYGRSDSEMAMVENWSALAASNGTATASVAGGNSVPFKYLLGPILVGVLLNCFVYGIVFLHYVQYMLGYNRDSWSLRAIVNWCFLVDSAHCIAALWLLWDISVRHFADTDFVSLTTWPIASIPLFIGATAAPTQHLFAWRIKKFTHGWPLFIFISVLSIASASLGVATAVKSLRQERGLSADSLIPTTDAWLALAMTCDAILAYVAVISNDYSYFLVLTLGPQSILLYMHLMKSKTGFSNTDTIIGRLTRSSVETTVLSALFCVLYLLTMSIVPHTNFHILFSMPLGRIYTGTLLSTLNSRTTLREELYSGASMVGDRLAERLRRIPKEIGIAVEQDVQMDPLGDADLKLPDHDDHEDTPHGVDSDVDDCSSPTRDRKVSADDLEYQAV
ncbi:hypothetical protein GSI_12269 [Ganoderma sinense ZZ0214-1]|uniref:DUF6534 domain-containing protein n=1 Tax=Ganoderma sinense ZZ0214-1 TaxID=1077348 RepID=A0A2G8RYB6_9APHY|nr:hypothetical protein GSI_12269 [Ganoderma sinense ZZ0214-1]